jgi:hypothetical protein
VVGAAGLRRFRNDPATVVFFLGVFLTGIGSSYYHWNPNDETLFWDRLPMTLSFAAILAIVAGERVSKTTGAILLWAALAVGVFSLLLWLWTDDLRLYFWVQFFPALAVVSLFFLIPLNIAAHFIGLPLGYFMRLPRCSNSPISWSIRPEASRADTPSNTWRLPRRLFRSYDISRSANW